MFSHRRRQMCAVTSVGWPAGQRDTVSTRSKSRASERPTRCSSVQSTELTRGEYSALGTPEEYTRSSPVLSTEPTRGLRGDIPEHAQSSARIVEANTELLAFYPEQKEDTELQYYM
jgi:hypothetical protein